jgi:hypothetical protein
MSTPSVLALGSSCCAMWQVKLQTLDEENIVEVHLAVVPRIVLSVTRPAAQNFLAALQEQHALKPNSFKIVIDDTIITVRAPLSFLFAHTHSLDVPISPQSVHVPRSIRHCNAPHAER